MNRKIDMRIWAIVTSWNPLKLYIYHECYVRFGCNDYDPSTPSNIFSHLTNNQVTIKCMRRPDNEQILNKVPDNMWSLSQFKTWLNKNK